VNLAYIGPPLLVATQDERMTNGPLKERSTLLYFRPVGSERLMSLPMTPYIIPGTSNIYINLYLH
jgi:hypothetical protein